jgi:hypothetical protein
MSELWSHFPDDTLSPLNLAEKRWAIAVEQRDEKKALLLNELIAQAGRDPHGMNDAVQVDKHRQIARIKAEMDAEDARVHELWKEWVGLKPWVSKELKDHHGCDPAKCDYSVPDPEAEEKKFKDEMRKDLKAKEDQIKSLQDQVKRIRADLEEEEEEVPAAEVVDETYDPFRNSK